MQVASAVTYMHVEQVYNLHKHRRHTLPEMCVTLHWIHLTVHSNFFVALLFGSGDTYT